MLIKNMFNTDFKLPVCGGEKHMICVHQTSHFLVQPFLREKEQSDLVSFQDQVSTVCDGSFLYIDIGAVFDHFVQWMNRINFCICF